MQSILHRTRPVIGSAVRRLAPLLPRLAQFSRRSMHIPRLTTGMQVRRNFCLDVINVPLEKVRNVAIIAHVDHGKTTLVDCLLKESGYVVEHNARIMDSNELEKEKGITIMSKVTGIPYNGHFINLVDTPGHQDFGGEVERIMDIVDGVILVVCSTEGPMAQTRFVLKKALEAGKRPIVVLNKVDRESSRITEVEDEILELFMELDEEEKFFENYLIFHAAAKQGFAVKQGEPFPAKGEGNTTCILQGIIDEIKPPHKDDSSDMPAMLVSQVDHSKYFGKLLRGRVESAIFKVGDPIESYDNDGNLVEEGTIGKIFKNINMEPVEVSEAHPGEIYSFSGLSKTQITHTLCQKGKKRIVQSRKMDPPMILIKVRPNSSPLAGREAEKQNSLGVLRERLQKESELDAALEIDSGDTEIILKGRGDLHLGILLEKLRREGFELESTCPTVITKLENGVELESVERVIIEAEDTYIPKIMDRIMHREGDIVNIHNLDNGIQKIEVDMFTRTMFGFRLEVLTLSSNSALFDSHIVRWEQPPEFEVKERASLVSVGEGSCTSYALRDLEKLGCLFVANGTYVYEGMIVGESNTSDTEWNVNPTKLKKLTNVRSAGKEEIIRLSPPRIFKVEDAISYIKDDELVEITPRNIRLRKKERNAKMRKSIKNRGGSIEY